MVQKRLKTPLHNIKMAANAIEERQCKNRSTKKKPTIKNARHPFFCKTPFLKIRLKIKFWLIFECPMKIQVLFLLIPFKD